MKSLASIKELQTDRFRCLMFWLNTFAGVHGLLTHTDWSKVWEYPWVWFGLSDLCVQGKRVLDIGSELSPMPWFLASLGADVWMVEKDRSFVPTWQRLKERGFSVYLRFVEGAELPFIENSFDLVLSFSVLEHIPDKHQAVDEAVRVLRPGGRLALTFDICEREMGMTYPAWGGEPLDMASFDEWIWNRSELTPLEPGAGWNTEDMPDFVRWHLRSAPHHNYTVGGAILTKKEIPVHG